MLDEYGNQSMIHYARLLNFFKLTCPLKIRKETSNEEKDNDKHIEMLVNYFNPGNNTLSFNKTYIKINFPSSYKI